MTELMFGNGGAARARERAYPKELGLERDRPWRAGKLPLTSWRSAPELISLPIPAPARSL
jgi:hypothetical protein